MKLEIDLNVLFPGGGVDILKSLANLLTLGNKIMTKISDAVAAQKAAFARLETSITGIGEDLAALNAKLAELQATQGQLTPEDQALLDEASNMSDSLATRFEALDALTAAATPVPVTDPDPVPGR